MLLLFLCSCFLCHFLSIEAKNTLLIIADDGGLEGGIFGNPVIRTPHLDELGRKSTKFTNAFTSVSSCSPRSAILTGLPNHQNGMYGLHQGVHHFDSFDSITSLPNVLRREKKIFSGIIGKKHVGPKKNYKFNIEHTEEQESILQTGRNITHIKLLVRKFLKKCKRKKKDFFLYVAFHDPHRCGHTNPEFGSFCQKFGDGSKGIGSIPDWKPDYYNPEEVVVPYFVPDTPVARQDIADQYTTISRLDQGIGLVLKEIESAGFSNDTLIIYSSDNGIPFPSGRTNFYEPGIRLPFLISSPDQPKSHGLEVDSPISLLDIFPTILEWSNASLPKTKNNLRWTGKSVLPFLDKVSASEDRSVFGSHSFHEVTMAYPMRFIRTKRFKLIHNINYQIPFPIDQDFYISPTFQDILTRTKTNSSLEWYKTLRQYYVRPEWEFFDLKTDPREEFNVAEKQSYQAVIGKLKNELFDWLNVTKDPWICSPHAVLEDKGAFSQSPSCMPLYNEDLTKIINL